MPTRLVNGVRVEMTQEEIDERKAIDAAFKRVASASAYKRKRVKDYKSIGEQLDMLYRDIKGGFFGEPPQIGEWFSHIDGVKKKAPKPE